MNNEKLTWEEEVESMKRSVENQDRWAVWNVEDHFEREEFLARKKDFLNIEWFEYNSPGTGKLFFDRPDIEKMKGFYLYDDFYLKAGWAEYRSEGDKTYTVEHKPSNSTMKVKEL